MFNVIKRFNSKYPFLKWVFGLIIIGIPLIIEILISLIPFGIGNDISWLSFWGEWLGAIIGSSVSILGIYFTLQYNEKQFKQTIKDNRTQYEEDKLLSLMPHLKPSISTLDGNRYIYFNNSNTSGFNFGNAKRRDIKIMLKNIGIGSALGIKFKIGKYLGNAPFETEYVTFDLGVNEAEYLNLSLFEMNDEYYNLELEYTDILAKHTYKQNGIFHVKSTGNITILMNCLKSNT